LVKLTLVVWEISYRDLTNRVWTDKAPAGAGAFRVRDTAKAILALHGNPPRFCYLMFGQLRLENAVLEAGLDLLGIHRDRLCKNALEAAIGPLRPLIVRLSHPGLWLALTV
jgi:hypothetical protein